eukprot:15365701-Ditylum_brightwellii.AAC.2
MAPCQTDLMLANPDTKPNGENNLKTKIDHLIGVQYYPPPDTEHYDLLFNSHKVQIPSKSDISNSSPSTT